MSSSLIDAVRPRLGAELDVPARPDAEHQRDLLHALAAVPDPRRRSGVRYWLASLLADLYMVTPPMCDVVVAAAQSLTAEDLLLLDADDLPSPTVLLVLPHPLLVRSVGGDLGDDRALCWHTPARSNVPDPLAEGRVHGLPAVRIATYHDTNGPVRPDSFLEMAADARRAGTPLPPLLLDAVRCLEGTRRRSAGSSASGLSPWQTGTS